LLTIAAPWCGRGLSRALCVALNPKSPPAHDRESSHSTLDKGGVVAANMVEITIDAEAIMQEE
jgi:hypothetical protein